VAQTAIGKKVRIRLLRSGKVLEQEATIAEQPKSMARGKLEPEDEEVRSAGAFAGVEARDLTAEVARRFNLPRDDRGGVVVVRVADGSPAEEAGIQAGDVIIEINRKPVTNQRDFMRAVEELAPKESALVLVLRNGRSSYLTIKP
jgi:serine protease Do